MQFLSVRLVSLLNLHYQIRSGHISSHQLTSAQIRSDQRTTAQDIHFFAAKLGIDNMWLFAVCNPNVIEFMIRISCARFHVEDWLAGLLEFRLGELRDNHNRHKNTNIE